jgi:adenylate cyclase
VLVARYLSPLAREPPCWVQEAVYGVCMEVERKFLVRDPLGLAATEADEIEQGYLAIGSDGEVRVRRKGDRLLLTAKRGSGLARQEAEIELDQERFDELWPLTEGRRLQKSRHVLPHGDLKIEVDVYRGELEGLMVAEIEFPSEEEARAFDPPHWLGEEVTGDHRYLNETLATAGAPSSRFHSH